MNKKILIKGAGELASATAHRLFSCGFHCIMTDLPRPKAVRRQVSYSTALIENVINIEGVWGKGHALQDWPLLADFEWDHIPVFVDPECQIKEIFKPHVIIDARLLKRNQGNRKDDAALTIALGPGIEAGKNVDIVIETQRGHNLGRLIHDGEALPNTGIPGSIGGFTKERVLNAPKEGLFLTDRDIGELVNTGEPIGSVSGQKVTTQIPGIIRGLLLSNTEVTKGQKLGDIDPRGKKEYCNTISDKARTISGSVLEAILTND